MQKRWISLLLVLALVLAVWSVDPNIMNIKRRYE